MIRKLGSDITTMMNSLCELRQNNQGLTPQAESLAKGIETKLDELFELINTSATNVEKSGKLQPAHTGEPSVINS